MNASHIRIVSLKEKYGNNHPEPDLGNASILKNQIGKRVFLIRESGKKYLFAPESHTYCSLNQRALGLIQKFDGQTDLGSIFQEFKPGQESVAALTELIRAGILLEHDASNMPVASSPPKPAKISPGMTLCLTTDCNLGCRYCYASSGSRKKYISSAIYRPAINHFLGNWFGKSLEAGLALHGGGEPTLNLPLLKDIVSSFRDKCARLWLKPKIHITSNGTFSKAVLKLIIENDINIGISLDGPPSVQNIHRPFNNGYPSYDRVLNNIRLLIDSGRDIAIRSTVSAASMATMPETVELAHEVGISTIQFAPLFMTGRALDTEVRAPDPEEFASLLLVAFQRGLELGVEVKSDFLLSIEQTIKRYCGAAGTNFVVTPDGHITTCFEVLDPSDPASRVFFTGEVNTEKGEVLLWQNKFDYLLSRNAENMSRCEECYLRFNCAGGCLTQPYRTYGDIFGVLKESCSAKRRINRTVIALVADGSANQRKTYQISEFLF